MLATIVLKMRLLLTSLLLISIIMQGCLIILQLSDHSLDEEGSVDIKKPDHGGHHHPLRTMRITFPVTSASKVFEKSRFTEWTLITHGYYGNIYRASDQLKGGKLIVIKDIWGNHHRAGLLEEVNVLETMSKTNFTRFIHYYGSFSDYGMTYLVLEYLLLGTLESHIVKNGSLKEEIIASAMYQLSSALVLLNESGFVHNDMYAKNVMLADIDPSNRNLYVKLVDFGLAMKIDLKRRPWWGYPPKSDVYRFGALLYFLATALEPQSRQLRRLNDTKFLALSADLRSLIRGMVTSVEATRYSHREVLNHPFVQSGKLLAEKWPLYDV